MIDSLLQWMGLGADLTAVFGGWGAQLAKIIWINILLSGDNAVVIALACRGLPPAQRRWGIFLGALVAILMRIGFTVIAAELLQYKWLMLGGSMLLFYIAVKLLTDDGAGQDVQQSTSIWGAVRTVAVADLIMSLDNVVAIAAAAKGDWSLILLGLLTSMPLIIFGATFVMWLLHRVPVLIWAGAALLGWIAGELAVADPGLIGVIKTYTSIPLVPADSGPPGAMAVVDIVRYGVAGVGALLVVLLGAMLRPSKSAVSA
jgi:YjbE family integral membrane protein